MKIKKLGSATNVQVSAREVEEFKSTWPCSGLPNKSITFQFDNRNGDLIEFWPANLDGSALVALADDAKKFANL